MNAYEQLEAHFKRINDLGNAQSILGWDRQVNMPSGGAHSRAETMATLSRIVHELITSPQVGDWLEECNQLSLTPKQRANIREIRRIYTSATALPDDLVAALSKATSLTEQAWNTCRPENDWNTLAPKLEEVISLVRQKAQALAGKLSLSPYDAMLSEFQPGITQADIDPVFAKLASTLPQLIEDALQVQIAEQRLPSPPGPAKQADQHKLALKIMDRMGFSFKNGRLDISSHPFCGGTPEDVRITTRYDEKDFLSSLMGVIHETGHALYEMHRPPLLLEQPVGNSRGMMVHESQSLIMEMQVARSKAFLQGFAAVIWEHIGPEQAAKSQEWSPDALYRAFTRVRKGLIRVDADECTYPLHVILRYGIEKDLLSGKLATKDLPDRWDADMQKLFGLSTKGDNKNGCMQDPHWYGGAFGYFPTYTLGAVMAAQLMAALRKAYPNVDAELAQGILSTVNNFLMDNIWSQGCLLETGDLIQQATGKPLSTDDFLTHLRGRYLQRTH